MARNDILLDTESGDLAFSSGDLATGTSDEQHINHLLLSSKLDWKQNPLIGVGVEKFIGAPGSSAEKLKRDTIEQLNLDGYNIKNLSITDDFQLI